MQLLAQNGRWSASQPVECKLYESEQALQVSLAENSGREAMHPADQMEAFRRLIEGEGLDGRTGGGTLRCDTVLTVERRLKLARLAPRFLDMYRADEIEAEQLQALALTRDHAAQEAIWDGLPPTTAAPGASATPSRPKACSADSRLARFVGLEAYEAEGGTVRRDLFASPGGPVSIYLDNPNCCRRSPWTSCAALPDGNQEEGWALGGLRCSSATT